MPITHTRLNRIIQAAEHYKQRYESLYNRLLYQSSQIANGSLTIPDAFRDITDHLSMVTQGDLTASTVINEERTRYNLTASRNATERLRLIKKRAQAASRASTQNQHQVSTNSGPSRTAAQIAAEADSTDEALAGLSDLSPGHSDLHRGDPLVEPLPSYLDAETRQRIKADQAKLSTGTLDLSKPAPGWPAPASSPPATDQ